MQRQQAFLRAFTPLVITPVFPTGHGKLILGDGGYYEGTFVRGEMDGHGYRYGLFCLLTPVSPTTCIYVVM